MYDNQETFFFRESELDDSFYLTQEISKNVYRSQIATKKVSPEKRSFLPKIKSKQSQIVKIDPNNHLARRKRQKNKPFINMFREIIVSNHIQGVVKQATNQVAKSHNEYIQSVADSIGNSFTGKQNIKQFAAQQKLLTKKLNKNLLQTKSKSLTATKTIQELIQQREKLKTQNEIILSRVNLLTQYEHFCEQIFGNHRKSEQQKTIFNSLLSEDQMIDLLDKTQQKSLGQSEHIKLIHLSIAQIRKDYQVVKKYFQPKINTLIKQVDALKIRQNIIDTQTNYYKFERMKMKNISNVRHPYLTIAPKVISFGIEKMKMNIDSRQIKAPLIVLKQLQVQVQQIIQILKQVKNGNEQRIDKLELQFIKNQSHQAHKSKK